MLIVGIGNTHRGDDAAGRIVAQRLRQRLTTAVSVREAAGDLSCLLDLWEGETAVFLIDAIRSGRQVGAVVRFELEGEPLPAIFSPMSTHALGLREAIELARTLDRLPDQVVIFGIEGARFGVGEPMSSAVESACERVTAEVIEKVQACERPVGSRRTENR